MGNGGQTVDMSGATVTNPGGRSPGAEGVSKVIDGLTSTKWLDFNKKGLLFSFSNSMQADAFRFTTANDDTTRDPVSWTVSSSMDGISYRVVAQQSDFATPTARRTATQWFALTPPPAPNGCPDGAAMAATVDGQEVSHLASGSKFFPWVSYNAEWYPICGHFLWDNNNAATAF